MQVQRENIHSRLQRVYQTAWTGFEPGTADQETNAINMELYFATKTTKVTKIKTRHATMVITLHPLNNTLHPLNDGDNITSTRLQPLQKKQSKTKRPIPVYTGKNSYRFL